MKIFNSPEPDQEIFKRFFKKMAIALLLIYPIFLANTQLHRWFGDKVSRAYNEQKIERNLQRFWIESMVFSFILVFIKEEADKKKS